MANNQVYYTSGGGDEQYTPAKTVELLLPHIQHLKNKTIWCPFDREDSQFVQVLRKNGFKVTYSHIDYGQDFFAYEPEAWDVIISNPPYTNKRRYWERCLALDKPFALLLPVNILSDSVINVSLRERERERRLRTAASAAHPIPKNTFLQRKNWRNRQKPNFQSSIFCYWGIQTTDYSRRFREIGER